MNKTMKKNFIIKITLSLIISSVLSTSYAEEVINLNIRQINNLKVPESNESRLNRVNQRSEYSSFIDYDKIDYFTPEEEVFESKTGQIFTKFINEKAINNKINSRLTY